MTPLDAMLTGPRPRLDGARNPGDQARPDAGSGFDAVLTQFESRERPEPATPPDAGTEPAAGPAPRAATPGTATLDTLLAGALPRGGLRPGDADLAALMERAAGRAPAQAPAREVPAPIGAMPAASTPGSGTPGPQGAASGSPGSLPGPGSAAATAFVPTLAGATRILAIQARADAAPATTASSAKAPPAETAAPLQEAVPPHLAGLRPVPVPEAPAARAEVPAVAPDGEGAASEPEAEPAPADDAPFAAVPWPMRVDPALAFPLPAAPAAPASVSAAPTQTPGPAADPAAGQATVPAAMPRSAVVVIAQETHFAPVAARPAPAIPAPATPVGEPAAQRDATGHGTALPGAQPSVLHPTPTGVTVPRPQPVAATPASPMPDAAGRAAAAGSGAVPAGTPNSGALAPAAPPAGQTAGGLALPPRDPVSPIPPAIATAAQPAAALPGTPAGPAGDPDRTNALPASPSSAAPARAAAPGEAALLPRETVTTSSAVPVAASRPGAEASGFDRATPTHEAAISARATARMPDGPGPQPWTGDALTTGPAAPSASAPGAVSPSEARPSSEAKPLIEGKPSVETRSSTEPKSSAEARPSIETGTAPAAGPSREAHPFQDARSSRQAGPSRDAIPVSEARLLPEARLSQETRTVGPATPGERRAEDPAAGMTVPAVTAEAAPVPTALPAATLRQIADAVATGAASLPDPASVRAGAVAAAWSAAAQAEGPLRLLTLQLRPAELGQVQVRMRLQDGRLEMSLRAEREETAELLRRDGGLLTALVREAGYQPELVTVQAGRLPGQPDASPQGGGQALPSFGGQQQHGGASPDQPARRTPDAPEEGGRRSMEQRDDAHSGDRDRGGLYL